MPSEDRRAQTPLQDAPSSTSHDPGPGLGYSYGRTVDAGCTAGTADYGTNTHTSIPIRAGDD
eukprot:scaffold17236_cov41-Prasinocladus_malaysianus.AAC.2